ncbi:MAG: penicillin-binding protein 2 [Legionellales bacterium]|jgi:cell division protein FtsI (penicillin-binding protein 3)|nr:penicillin-binding protein 2 [Legionellales bacterium]
MQNNIYSFRFYFAALVLVLMVSGLIYRLAQLTVYERSFLQDQSNARSMRVVDVPVSRGMVFDRNGFPLAASTMLKSLWVDPGEVDLEEILSSDLSEMIGVNKELISNKIKSNSNKEFVYLKRHMDPNIESPIRKLSLSGIGLQKEYKRYYPDSESVAHLVGRTNIDDKGVEGIELAYDSWLRGDQGKELVRKDRLGRTISKSETIVAAKNGNDLFLSIDKKDQAVAYDVLAKGVEESGAKSGSLVVLDAKTGEVLALTNYPSYNPNDTKNIKIEQLRNRAVTDLFEPGSTVKPFSMLYALESGKHNVDEKVYIGKGRLELEGHVITDVHNREDKISLTDILVHSSNVGIAKLILDTPVSEYIARLTSFGFGESSGSGFPGEPSGTVIDSVRQGSFDQASLSYGYGTSITLLQLARAYMNLASCGSVRNINLLKNETEINSSRKENIDSANCKIVHGMMAKVTEPGGTGFRAAVKGFSVAGKTGTSYIASNKGYDTDRYISTFAGFAPADDPRYVAAIVLWEPDKAHHFGGRSAAPIFAKIMQHMLVFKTSESSINSYSKRRYN